MPRVKNSVASRNRRKKVLKLSKGYFGSKHLLYRTAHEQVMRSLRYAYRDRRQIKREMRKLWITRINAGARMNDMSYSELMFSLKRANIEINRKMLSELAINDPAGFSEIVRLAKTAPKATAKSVSPAPVAAEPVMVEEKPAVKKAPAKKADVKATEAEVAPAKKPAAKPATKASAAKAPAKKPAAKKAASSTTADKKPAAKKPAKTAEAKPAAKKPAAKKAPAKTE